jgi:hypothetical protein
LAMTLVPAVLLATGGLFTATGDLGRLGCILLTMILFIARLFGFIIRFILLSEL